MQSQTFLDEITFPPFDGFPSKGLEFLKKLKRNNNRQWFTNHKDEYETFVKLPMYSLIASLQPLFEEFASEFDLAPKKAVFRIYRDIRFSKDKTPYKTHIAAHLVLRGKPKGFEGSGFYFHVEPGEVFIGGGIYMPDGDQLKKIRRAIVNRPEDFLSVVQNKSFKKFFGELDGSKLQRVPLEFDAGHPMVHWLKFKQFFVGKTFGDDVCRKESFLNLTASVCEKAYPLVRFLNEAITK
jgi:uncharacterized protein (TIGR02453 family)